MTLARWLMTKPGQLAGPLSTPFSEVPVPRTKKFKSTKTPCFRLVLVLNRRLNFKRSFENCGGMAMPWDRPVVTRLLTAVMLASVGGLLFLSSQWVRMGEAPRDQASPASLEMMQLLHDEHQLIGEMVKAQLAMPDSGFLDSKPIAATERRQAIALR
jgi:hypothetical protein